MVCLLYRLGKANFSTKFYDPFKYSIYRYHNSEHLKQNRNSVSLPRCDFSATWRQKIPSRSSFLEGERWCDAFRQLTFRFLGYTGMNSDLGQTWRHRCARGVARSRQCQWDVWLTSRCAILWSIFRKSCFSRQFVAEIKQVFGVR